MMDEVWGVREVRHVPVVSALSRVSLSFTGRENIGGVTWLH